MECFHKITKLDKYFYIIFILKMNNSLDKNLSASSFAEKSIKHSSPKNSPKVYKKSKKSKKTVKFASNIPSNIPSKNALDKFIQEFDKSNKLSKKTLKTPKFTKGQVPEKNALNLFIEEYDKTHNFSKTHDFEKNMFKEENSPEYLKTVRRLFRRNRDLDVNLSQTSLYKTERSVKETYEELENIINDEKKHKLVPTIINPESNFVVITYYWGGPNINMNTQKPCEDYYIEIRKKNKEIRKKIAERQRRKTARILNKTDTPEEEDDEKELKLIPIPPIKQKAITFNKMIENWKKNMKEVNCNFLVEEYPEFAVPGGYQLAINAKPLFIKKALESCGHRAVVYIDGDMTIHRYPDLFDIRNVDYMARGWNIDPRASDNYNNENISIDERICYDNYVFETSGGIMYFSQSDGASQILKKFINMSKKEINKGKADDRIVSLLFNSYTMFARYNIIQLPIEYLWLGEFYHEYIPRKDYGQIMVDHPACLTSEDVAKDKGAASNREPKFYNALVSNNINCRSHGGIFYEYIFFEDVGKHYDRAAKTYEVYLRVMKNLNTQYRENTDIRIPPFYVIPMLKTIRKKTVVKNDTELFEFQIEQHYGKEYGRRAKENIKLSKKYMTTYYEKNTFQSFTSNNSNKASHIGGNNSLEKYIHNLKFIKESETDCIPKILAALADGYDVIYLPKYIDKSINKNIIQSMIVNRPTDVELMAFIDDDYEWNNMEQYNPSFHTDKPFFFSTKSRILYHLIALCKNINKDFNKHFNSSFIFLTRIRCLWLDPDFNERIFKKINYKQSALLDVSFNIFKNLESKKSNKIGSY